MVENASKTSATRPTAAIILAAGQSKRMKSDLVKVLHDVADRPMLAWVIDACRGAGCESITVVVGHQGQRVMDAFSDQSDVDFVWQREQLGTGHAVMQAADRYSGYAGDIIVLAGDGPLIREATLRALIAHHRSTKSAATLASAHIDDPTGYGRILRSNDGRFDRIVEHKDADEAQRAITEINPSYYCFDAEKLFSSLSALTNANANSEYYLTDVCAILRRSGQRVEIADVVDSEEIHSINDMDQLRHVSALLASRLKQGAAQ